MRIVIGPGGMSVGWWVEMPVDDDEPTWVQIGAILPPVATYEDRRWAIRVRRGRDHWWVLTAPHLTFPVCDVNPE